MNVKSRIEPLLEQLSLSSNLIFGEAIERDQVTVIPVSKIKMGFGLGHGREGAGGGGGVSATPVGYIEITARDTKFVPIRYLSWQTLLVMTSIVALFVLKMFRK